MHKTIALTAALAALFAATASLAAPPPGTAPARAKRAPSAIAKQLAALDTKADSLRAKLGTVQGMIADVEKPFADGVAELKGKEEALKTQAAQLQQQYTDQIAPDLDRYNAQCCKPSCEAAQDSSTTGLTQDEASACNTWSAQEFLPYSQAAQKVVDDENAREAALADLQAKWAAVESSDDYQALIAKRQQIHDQLEAAMKQLLKKCKHITDRDSTYPGRICFDGEQEGLPDGDDLQPAGTRFFGQ